MVRQIPSTDVGEEALRHHDSYYTWLCNCSGIEGPLAQLFFETDFRWNEAIPDDANRAKKAREELRERYAQHLLLGEDGLFTEELRHKIDRVVKSILGPACVFEVLVSLAMELDEMLNLEDKPEPEKYFARLMSNVGFDFYDEEDYDDNPEKVTKYWKKLMDGVLDRTYLPDGEGGLFPLDMSSESENPGYFDSGGDHDQRYKSLWEQLQAWVDEEPI